MCGMKFVDTKLGKGITSRKRRTLGDRRKEHPASRSDEGNVIKSMINDRDIVISMMVVSVFGHIVCKLGNFWMGLDLHRPFKFLKPLTTSPMSRIFHSPLHSRSLRFPHSRSSRVESLLGLCKDSVEKRSEVLVTWT